MRPDPELDSPSRTPPSSSTPPATRRTGFFDRPGLYMVPLKVHFGDETFRDGVDMTYQEFFAKLEASEVLPTTSQPTAGEFTGRLRGGAGRRYEHVFSLHISGEMSGTVRSAEQAAEAIDGVEVYDMRTVTTALSLCAERLRARLERGCTLDEARAYIEHFTDHSSLLVHAATLEYLRRGGRIGRAASLVGGVFDIKPLISPPTAPCRATPRCAASRRPWPPWSASSRRTASPTTSCTSSPSTPSTTRSRSSSAR